MYTLCALRAFEGCFCGDEGGRGHLALASLGEEKGGGVSALRLYSWVLTGVCVGGGVVCIPSPFLLMKFRRPSWRDEEERGLLEGIGFAGKGHPDRWRNRPETGQRMSTWDSLRSLLNPFVFAVASPLPTSEFLWL